LAALALGTHLIPDWATFKKENQLMASISNDPGGRRHILFVDKDGNRKAVRLGKVNLHVAEEVWRRVEALNTAAVAGVGIDRDLARWVSTIGDELHGKLAAVGLVSARNRMNLGEFLDAFLTKRDGTKVNSFRNFVQAKDRLLGHFGKNAKLADVMPSMAEDWVTAMSKAGYAKATIGRAIKYAKQFFKAAMRDKIIAENPFADIKAPAQTNEAQVLCVE
jgi:Phage integrase SAM-like domain